MFRLDQSHVTTRRLLTCGVIGAPLFSAVALIEGATRPGYNPWGDYVSRLALSDQGWEQIANFIVTGLLMFGFAIGARRAVSTGTGSTSGPILLFIYSISIVLAGVFVIDPGNGYPAGVPETTTWHGTIHSVVGAVGVFLTLPLACLILARRGSLIWTAYSIASGILMLGCFVGSWDGPMLGVYQRLAIGLGWTWLVVLALRLRASIDQRAAPPVRAVPSQAAV